MTIQQLKLLFKDNLDFLDLDLIIAGAIKKPREFVLAYPEAPINKKQESMIRKNIKKRINHEPLAYILGHKEFFGLDFAVNKNVLIPRPETELLVERVSYRLSHSIERETRNMEHVSVIDVGTGSGNIIISLAKNLKRSALSDSRYAFYGIDLSAKALRVAKKNSQKNKVAKEIKFLRGNLLEPIIKNEKYKLKNKKIFITANLPYLENEWKNILKNKESAGLKFEPRLALEGGKDGLDLYRKLATQIKILKNKNNSIHLFCEIGHLQKNEMKHIFSFAEKVGFLKDLAGKWRVFEAEI